MLKYGDRVRTKELVTIKNAEGEYCEIMKDTRLKVVGNEDIKTRLVLVTTGDVLAYVNSDKLYEVKKWMK